MATITFVFATRSNRAQREALFTQLRQHPGVLDVSWLMEDADDPELARTALAEVRDDAVADLLFLLRKHRSVKAADPPLSRHIA